MPFSFHPPTGRPCEVCDELLTHDKTIPIIDTHNGKASSANNFPFHNWYNFVLGYSPQFPEYILHRENLQPSDQVLDPFMGTGTSLITCKQNHIPSAGLDANDFMVEASRVKLDWSLDTFELSRVRDDLLRQIEAVYSRYTWDQVERVGQLSLFSLPTNLEPQNIQVYLETRRSEMLLQKYISDKPLARALMIDDVIKATIPDSSMQRFFNLALTSIIVPISNVRYGPGFGMIKPRDDAPVLEIFAQKLERMTKDLKQTSASQQTTSSSVLLGDARHLSKYFAPNSVSLMMTSPPYPGDHEYTKHTRLELIFRDYAATLSEFQTIKRRMIRASTTNIFKEDHDRELVGHLKSIQAISALIQERLDEDGATSGFEKLYTKLIWEYFGGMFLALKECFAVLKPGGKIALLVSDSHAFKMVHVQTAAILQEIGLELGFIDPEIILWQVRPSTSHKYWLRENILIFSKP